MDAADSTPDQFAPDSVAADSEMMEEVADSMAADSEEIVPESEEMIVAPESQQFVVPESQQFVAPESQQFISPESEEIVSPESEEIVVPDSSPPGAFICGTCQVVHLNREAWDRVHTGRYPCSRCGPFMNVKLSSNKCSVFLVYCTIVASSQQSLVNLISDLFTHFFPSVAWLNLFFHGWVVHIMFC